MNIKNLWEKFEERMDEPARFGWDESWDYEVGNEEYIDYVGTFTKDKIIPKYDESKHIGKNLHRRVDLAV